MGARPPFGPHGLRSSERALAAVDGLGLDAYGMTSAVNTVLAYVCGTMRREQSAANTENSDGTARYLLNAVSSGEYPQLARVFNDTQDLTEAASYDAGLGQVLDGIGVRIAASG
jgi:hypothetical protein